MGKHERPDESDEGWVWTGREWRYAPLAAETATTAPGLAAPFSRPAAFSRPPAPATAPAGGGTPPYAGFGSSISAEPDPWRPVRVWWDERSASDRRILIVVAALTILILIIGVTAGNASSASSSSSTGSSATPASSAPIPTGSQRAAFVSAFVGQSPVSLTTGQAQQAAADGVIACGLARDNDKADLAEALNHPSNVVGDRSDILATGVSNDLAAMAPSMTYDPQLTTFTDLVVNLERDSSAYFCPDKPPGA